MHARALGVAPRAKYEGKSLTGNARRRNSAWCVGLAGAVSARLPSISRATVYATLALFVERGLLRELALEEGRVVYDPKLEPHHHFIDDATGAIVDVPWDALAVRGVPALPGVDVREYQVVLRGSLRAGDRRSSPPTPHPQA